jgi:hypothetical protein
MPRLWVVLAMLMVGVGVARADQYWIAYEGTAYPWLEGWERIVRGGGAQLSFEEQPEGGTALIIDSRASTEICDSYYQYMPSLPEPPDVFRAEWRLRVDEMVGFADLAVGVSFSAGGEVMLEYAMDRIYSLCEGHYVAEFEAGVYHEYALTSTDMLTYALFVDGALAYMGELVVFPHSSWVQWGDAVTGAASLSAWDYARFGVLPAPLAGDVNCDGTVDFRDINPFVQALADGEAYQNTYSGCWPENADINSDGSVDFGDINPFIEVLTS